MLDQFPAGSSACESFIGAVRVAKLGSHTVEHGSMYLIFTVTRLVVLTHDGTSEAPPKTEAQVAWADQVALHLEADGSSLTVRDRQGATLLAATFPAPDRAALKAGLSSPRSRHEDEEQRGASLGILARARPVLPDVEIFTDNDREM